MAEKNAPRNTPTIGDLRNPLLAAVGVLDLALEQLKEMVDAVRERTEEARSDAGTRAEETRERLTKRGEELRERLSAEELRNAYQSLAERGEAALERLRTRTGKAAIIEKGDEAEQHPEELDVEADAVDDADDDA